MSTSRLQCTIPVFKRDCGCFQTCWLQIICPIKLQHWQRKSIHFFQQVCFETSGNFPNIGMWHLHSLPKRCGNMLIVAVIRSSQHVGLSPSFNILSFPLGIWWNLRCIDILLWCNHDVVFENDSSFLAMQPSGNASNLLTIDHPTFQWW